MAELDSDKASLPANIMEGLPTVTQADINDESLLVQVDMNAATNSQTASSKSPVTTESPNETVVFPSEGNQNLDNNLHISANASKLDSNAEDINNSEKIQTDNEKVSSSEESSQLNELATPSAVATMGISEAQKTTDAGQATPSAVATMGISVAQKPTDGGETEPLTITVNEEGADGRTVPTKLLIYPGSLSAEHSTDEILAGRSSQEGGSWVIDLSSKEQASSSSSALTKQADIDTNDGVSTILFQLTQNATGIQTIKDTSDTSTGEAAQCVLQKVLCGAKDSQQAQPIQTTETIFHCQLCDFVTQHKHNLKTHMLVHTKPNPAQVFKCEECEYSTTLKYNLKTHMKKHAKLVDLSENDIFRCKDCDYVSAYKHDFQTHMMKHADEKPFKCDQCSFASIYKHSLIHHVSSKHKKERPYKCTECSYSSARKQDLQNHMGKHAELKPFQCQFCDYGTPFKQSFKAHMNRHLGNKVFKCDEPDCEFSTTTSQNLSSHKSRHKKVKKYKCKFCDYTASHKTQLITHEVKHIENKDKMIQRVFQCPKCDYQTMHKYSMKRHEERHSENRTMPEKIFQCDQCEYQTGYKSSLKRHLAKHSEVKPFKCGHCDYSAINMTQMHVHIAKHTGIKPFKCDQCEYSTANKQHLVGHMAKHSDVKLKCPFCDFNTAWKQRLKMHIKQHKTGLLHIPHHRQILSRTQTTQNADSLYRLGLEDSVQQLYQIEHSETNEALSQLSNVIAAYQEQIQEDTAGQGESQEQPTDGGDPNIHIGNKGTEDQVLLIPMSIYKDTDATTVVVVDENQSNPQQVQLIMDDQSKPVLESALQTTISQPTEMDTASTEIVSTASEPISLLSETVSSVLAESTPTPAETIISTDSVTTSNIMDSLSMECDNSSSIDEQVSQDMICEQVEVASDESSLTQNSMESEMHQTEISTEHCGV